MNIAMTNTNNYTYTITCIYIYYKYTYTYTSTKDLGFFSHYSTGFGGVAAQLPAEALPRRWPQTPVPAWPGSLEASKGADDDDDDDG